MKTARDPVTIHEPLGAYTHQIEVSGPTRWLVLSGQVGQQEDDTVPDDPIAQLEVALENISRNLDAVGMTVRDIVKMTTYLVGDVDMQRRREVLAAWLGEHRPCMTLLYVAGLAAPRYRVEIDAWACDSAPG
jgi:2-iminobutanoate/2-iminopropanoate deaminase